jgi:NADPH-dependent 2,4-dienoyl-CoA reductase/sulfur reductase-like enzyme
MNDFFEYIIVGGGIASLSAIEAIRENDASSPILLIVGEDRLPYKRTKVNKHIRSGFTKHAFQLNDETWYSTNHVRLVFGSVTKLDKKKCLLTLHNQAVFRYRKLLLALGATPVTPRISGVTHQDFYRVHSAHQVEQLLTQLPLAQEILILGAGPIGVETADQLQQLGKKVVLVDRMNYPMERLFPKEFMNHLLEDFKKHAVEFVPNTLINRIEKENKQYITQIKGQNYRFDLLLAAAGSFPNIHLAKQSGLKTSRGICVNTHLLTSDPHIFAAGDVTEMTDYPSSGLWHAAEHQGWVAGHNMCDRQILYSSPSFRLKTELFGRFYFSQNYIAQGLPGIQTVKETKGQISRQLLVNEQKYLKGLVMMNDTSRAKQYEKAVQEEWLVADVFKNIPLQTDMI